MKDDRSPEQILAEIRAVIENARKVPDVIDLNDPNLRLVAKPDGEGGVIILAEPATA